MNRSNLLKVPPLETESPAFPKEGTNLYELYCGHATPASFLTHTVSIKPRKTRISPEWQKSVPSLMAKLSSLIAERKIQDLRDLVNTFDKRIHRLESMQTLVVPINTFAPEPYELLKTFFVSVHSIEGGFHAGWFDANIHTTGDNEEEAISNLKSLILDFFDSFSNEPPEKLGPEPTRQLAILKQYLQKKP
jgi:hypothetical protein